MKINQLPSLSPHTIASYWMERGCSEQEAKQLEKEQIWHLTEDEKIFDFLETGDQCCDL